MQYVLLQAVEMINALLSSGEEGLEEHKRTQLRELAVLNGEMLTVLVL